MQLALQKTAHAEECRRMREMKIKLFEELQAIRSPTSNLECTSVPFQAGMHYEGESDADVYHASGQASETPGPKSALTELNMYMGDILKRYGREAVDSTEKRTIVVVSTVSGTIIPIQVRARDPILVLKHRLQEECGQLIHTQLLMLAEQIMHEDLKTKYSYGVGGALQDDMQTLSEAGVVTKAGEAVWTLCLMVDQHQNEEANIKHYLSRLERSFQAYQSRKGQKKKQYAWKQMTKTKKAAEKKKRFFFAALALKNTTKSKSTNNRKAL
jgi:hypothetical protein